MSTLMRWEPFREIDRLQDEFSRLFGGYGRRGEGTWATGYAPPCDVREEAERFVVEIDLPGIEKNAIEVRVENDVLTVRGKRALAREEKRDSFHLLERAEGAFTRALSLPGSVDAGAVGAEYHDGVLTVTLPKRAEARPRLVQVKVK